MTISIEKGLEILTTTIQKGEQGRHKHYQRTLDVAKFAHQMLTGENQKELVVRYKARETNAQKEQRIRLYNPLTPYAAGQVKSIYNKVQRTDNVIQEIELEDTDKLTILKKKIKAFHSNKSLKSYLDSKLEHLSFYDPNAFLVTERLDIRNAQNKIEDTIIYPFEVSSSEAINYFKWNGNLVWLIVEHIKKPKKSKEIEIPGGQKLPINRENKPLSIFYFYAAGYVIKLNELEENESVANDTETIFIQTDAKITRKFTIETHENGTTEIPAIQVGSIPDPETKGQTFVTPLEPAKHIFKDLINLKSEFDLTRALHTFLQKIQYAPECTFQDNNGNRCESGYVDGHKCSECKGIGINTHLSSQDIIFMKLPDSKEDFIPLSELAHYVQLPEWLPKWQSEEIDKLINRISLAIFNTAILKQDAPISGDKTATEVRIEYDKIYDVISIYAARYSEVWQKAVRVSAQYLEIEDLKLMHKFPSDFKLKTTDELYNELIKSNESNAPYESRLKTLCDLLEKQYADNPEMVEQFKAKERFKPFASKTIEEITIILIKRGESDYDKVLYENFDRIFTEIEKENDEPFYLMEWEGQKKIVQDKVIGIVKEIQYRSANSLLTAIPE